MNLKKYDKIRNIIILGFAGLAFLVVITGATGVYFVKNIVKVLNDVTDYSAPLSDNTDSLIENLIESNGFAKEIISTKDSMVVNELIGQFDELDNRFREIWHTTNTLISESAENLLQKNDTAFKRQQIFNNTAHEMFSSHLKSLYIESNVEILLQDIDKNRTLLLEKLDRIINEGDTSKDRIPQRTNEDNILVLNATRNLQSQIIELQKIFRDYLTEENQDQFFIYEEDYQNHLSRAEQLVELIDNHLENLRIRDLGFRENWNLWWQLVTDNDGFFAQYKTQIQAENYTQELADKLDYEVETAVTALENISLYAENLSNRADERNIVVDAPYTLYVTIALSLFIIGVLGFFVSHYITISAKQIEQTMEKLELSENELRESNNELKSKINEIKMANEMLRREINERKKIQEELVKSKEELSKLTGYLLDIREEERAIISREIHDELGQSLTAIQIDATLINMEMPESNEYIHKKLNSMIELIQSTIKSVQKISAKLRPAMLDQLGLESAFKWYIGEFQDRTGISCDLDYFCAGMVKDKKISITLYRILQETLTNVARHAGASGISVLLKDENNRIEMTVADNGCGITDEQIKDSMSFGLRGMEERIKPLHGNFTIKGIAGQGTTVMVTLPLKGEKP